MNLIGRKIVAILQKEKVVKDDIERQIAYPYSNRKKVIVIIMVYRILQASNKGNYTSLSQYN